MNMRAVRTPPILTPTRHGCAGTVWTAELDRRGVGRAAFCRHRAARPARSRPGELADALDRLRAELDSPRRRTFPKWVWLNPAADAFVPGADDLRGPTLEAAAHLMRRRIGVTLHTRGGQPQGDGLLTLARRFPGLLRVEIGVFAQDRELCETWEIGAAALGSRLSLAQALQHQGADVAVRLGPIVPFVNDEEAELKRTLRSLAARNLRTVVPTFVEDAPGLVFQVEREVSRSQGRLLEGWFRAGEHPRGGDRMLAGSVRNARMATIEALGASLDLEIVRCGCNTPGCEETCLQGPRKAGERRQLDLFAAG